MLRFQKVVLVVLIGLMTNAAFVHEVKAQGYLYRYSSKGDFRLSLALPYFNTFVFKPENTEASKVHRGFHGLSAGVEYCFSEDHLMRVSGTFATDLRSPIPHNFNPQTSGHRMNSGHVAVSDNYKLGHFWLGYGLVYARNTWESTPQNPIPLGEAKTIRRTYNAFGLVLPLHIQASPNLNFGLIYRPTFFRPNLTRKFQYEYLISVDLAWKILLT